jgi:hypothetical protein
MKKFKDALGSELCELLPPILTALFVIVGIISLIIKSL